MVVSPELGPLSRSPARSLLTALRVPIRSKLDALPPTTVPLDGIPRTFSQPITLTPFASARPCSARCRFCSETLVHRGATRLSATLRPGPDYGATLERTLGHLTALPLGLSLSGLESTDDADWFADVLERLTAWQAQANVTERVLYTNGAGLAPNTTGPRLLPLLERLGLDRFEFSRHAPDAEANQRIMRFRDGVSVRAQEHWEAAVRAAAEVAPVRLVVVVQRGGVASLEGVEATLAMADRLGIRDVVFRELSRLGDAYRPGATTRYVEQARVPIESLLAALLPLRPGWAPVEIVAGYYYWNLRLRWRDRVDVTLETSDYTEMKRRHRSDVVYKLVLHADGALCGDWDPGTRVLLRDGRAP